MPLRSGNSLTPCNYVHTLPDKVKEMYTYVCMSVCIYIDAYASSMLAFMLTSLP